MGVESCFKQRLQSQANPMMHHSVTEISSEHLSELRASNDEAGARGWFVCPVLDLQSKFEKVFFEMRPVLHALRRCQFMAAAVFERFQPRQSVFFTKCRHGSHHVAIVLVVVVEIAGLKIDVPTIVTIVLRTRPVVRTVHCAD